MLKIDEVSFSYWSGPRTVEALGPISMQVQGGEICALIGPSGCGKSTLLHVLSGVLMGYQGQVELNGTTLDPKRHDIGFIPQNFGLLPWKNVEKNCLLSLTIKDRRMDAATRERVDQVMDRLDISHLRGRWPGELSGGERQRVAIARAFIMSPELLLMDEPFSALDALTREDAQDLFIDIWNQYKTTTVFVTHSIEEAVYMGSKIVIMSHGPGTIVETIDNPLFNSPDRRQQAGYLDLATHIRNVIKRGWARSEGSRG